ncbi:MAG: methyltransferase domain-containing protein [Gammaproteobacteria bacterium]|nr:methyltransferase domain-containing protein [Gammaproteobacteria bacterium]
MSDAREHWNRRYGEGWPMEPSPFLESIADLLPRSGRALDVAGGNGRNALWLADRGLSVTVVDVSDAALAVAADVARARGLTLDLVNADLETDDLPAGPWDLIVCFHYLQRSLFPKMAEALAPGGVLVCAIATVRNLERHPRPPREHVLDEGELPGLVRGLTVVYYEEGWFDDHHEARLVATLHA